MLAVPSENQQSVDISDVRSELFAITVFFDLQAYIFTAGLAFAQTRGTNQRSFTSGLQKVR